MTPNELNILADVIREKNESDFENKVTLAWLAEMYHRQEKLPPLRDCLDDLKPRVVDVDADTAKMIAMARQLNRQYGGEFK